MHGHSPFKADKNHLHHRLLLLGFSHIETTFIFIAVNILFIGLMIIFNRIGIFSLMLINMGLFGGLVSVPEILIRRGNKEVDVSYNPTVSRLKNASVKSA